MQTRTQLQGRIERVMNMYVSWQFQMTKFMELYFFWGNSVINHLNLGKKWVTFYLCLIYLLWTCMFFF